jgi:deferrochelatase/peroxidase EfeB
VKRVEVEWGDVQGLVLSGYPLVGHAAYIPWRFVSPEESKEWLRALAERLMRADQADPPAGSEPKRPKNLKSMKIQAAKKSEHVWLVNAALTVTGLEKLGVGKQEFAQFSTEFCEGMAPKRPAEGMPRRCNILGDLEKNSPEHWIWGGWTDNGEIDGMLLLFAASAASLEALIQEELSKMRGAEPLVDPDRAPEPLILRAQINDSRKEHFGFTDGISQPIIAGTPEAKRATPKEERILVVAPGEFVLGYPNERGERLGYPGEFSTKAASKHGSRDLVRNGSYLVFRHLEQNVPAFRAAVSQAARRMGETDDSVAARLVGRSQDGSPLIQHLEQNVPAFRAAVSQAVRRMRAKIDWVAARLVGRSIQPAAKPASKTPRNDFLYYFEDPFGLECPLGAHIRRANPRDIIGPDPDTALRLSKMHRIIRRGRSYGAPFTVPKKAEAVGEGQSEPGKAPVKQEGGADAVAGYKSDERGLFFIGLNANIAGQFELIQHAWLNNGRFNGLHDEADPVLNYPGQTRVLTIQRRPTCDPVVSFDQSCHPVVSFDQFVRVRGGAYFFLPGISALLSLTEAPSSITAAQGNRKTTKTTMGRA